jgi:hypothetical protein
VTPRFFPVSLFKLAILSLTSLGFYEIYWFYRHWKCERQHTGEKLSPLARGIFGPLFAYSLFRRIRSASATSGISVALSAGALAVAYFVWVTSWRLPDPYWLISLLSFVPLLPVQKVVNTVNAAVAPEVGRNDTFSGANVALIVIGVLFLILIVLGVLTPEHASTAAPAPRTVAA